MAAFPTNVRFTPKSGHGLAPRHLLILLARRRVTLMMQGLSAQALWLS